MDEFQFIESLDALLANEAIDETTTAAVELANSSISPVQGQGILSGPAGHGQVAETSGTSWLGGNDNSISTSDPFAISLNSNTGLSTVSVTPSVGSSFPQLTGAPIEQYGTVVDSKPKSLGPIQASALPTGSISTLTPGAKYTTMTGVTSLAPSGVASVCSANSLGSSNASSSKRRGNSKSNNSTISVGSASSAGNKNTKFTSRKRSRGGTSTAVSDSEDDSSRKRHDRNLREQRRSQKITHQIDQLREVLAAASVRFKPDKYSTLVSVVEYVKQLQRRSTMLDAEHKKLLETITRTNEIVNEPYLGNPGASSSSTADGSVGIGNAKPDSALSSGTGATDSTNGVAAVANGDIYNDDELVFVRNIDYKCIFENCGMPLAVASIDGRLMDCNHEFVKLTGYRREELLPNEKHQKQQRQDLHQEGSTIIADDVGSSFLGGTIYPERQTSSANSSKESNDRICATSHNNCSSGIRNFSLFNLLSRNNMEQVFVSLSEMLKQPPRTENGARPAFNGDYWSGNVRLSRNTHVEVRHISH